jgi:hypothetical protein
LRGPYSDVVKYRDFTGEVVASTEVISFMMNPGRWRAEDTVQLLQVYRVRLDTGPELDYVIEDCLQVVEG